MLPGDRLICAFLEGRTTGDIFTDWPLHITIIPWFRTDVSADDLTKEITDMLSGVAPFDMHIDGEAGFGYKGRKQVDLIALPSSLEAIERKCREILRGHDAWLVDETTKQRRPFRPHVTRQKNQRVHHGESYRCDVLYIVGQKGGCKEILVKIGL